MKITLQDLEHPTLQEIEDAPTEHVGQFANLKIERYQDVPGGMILVRYWLNRTTPADGETHRVDVEARTCPNGTWEDLGKLYPCDTDSGDCLDCGEPTPTSTLDENGGECEACHTARLGEKEANHDAG